MCGSAWPCRARIEEIAADTRPTLSHAPLRMLDISEVTVGCWVSWRGSENNLDHEGRGGIVYGIDHLLDEATGEIVKIFATVKDHRGTVRFDSLRGTDVGAITLPNASTIRGTWRAMARVIGKCRGTAVTDERRLAEIIPLLIRSVS